MTTMRRCVALGFGLMLISCSGGTGGPDGPNGLGSADPARGPAGGPGVPGSTGGGSPPVSGPAGTPGAATDPGTPAQIAAQPPAPTLRRLTLSQYQNSLNDLLGVIPSTDNLTPLPPSNGLRAVAASSQTLPERDIEAFGALASTLSAQVFSDPAARQKLTGCDAKQVSCGEGFVASFGRRAFRRPLSAEERTRYVALLGKATQATGDGWLGLQVVVDAMLQSPNLLYRAELGVPDPAAGTQRRLTDLELASRLSFFVWNSAPDVALLDAAEKGALSSKDGLSAQVERLLAAPRAAEATEELFSDYLQLEGLDSLTKLPETYPQATPTLGAALKQETLSTLRELVFKRAGDFRDVFVTTKTFVNAELAKLYGLSAPTGSAFTEVDLPANGPRAGIVLQGSFLALHAHPSRSSPTLRGKFIRESLLCRSIPPPPPDVVTTLPSSAGASTARQKLSAHRADPKCAGCHALMDPMGLSLESFDGIGAYRQKENGLTIDTSGELDGKTFQDARGMAAALAAHPDVAACFAKTLLRYARGALEDGTEEAVLDALSAQFAKLGYRMPDFMLAIATDRSFRYVGAL